MSERNPEHDRWSEFNVSVIAEAFEKFEVSRASIDEAFSEFETFQASASIPETVPLPPDLDAATVRGAPEISPPARESITALPAPQHVRDSLPKVERLVLNAVVERRWLIPAAGVVLAVALGSFIYVLFPSDTAPSHSDLAAPAGSRAPRASQLPSEKELLEVVARQREMVRLEPQNAARYAELGRSLTRLSKWEEAETAYRAAVSLEPNNPRWHDELGSTLVWVNKQDEATEHHRQAVRLEPDNAEWHNGLGVNLRLRQQMGEAKAAFKEALKIKPNNTEYIENYEDVSRRTQPLTDKPPTVDRGGI